MANTKAAKQDREELKALDPEALTARLEEENKKLWTDRFAMGKRQLEKTADLSKTRKRIARIHTYLRKLELEKK